MALTHQSRKGNKALVQPGRVWLRLIQSVNALTAAGMPPGEGTPVTLLTNTFVPTISGLNSRTARGRGFLEGWYERRMKEEGSFSLTFPNAVGTDGKLHRLRFLSLSQAAGYNYRQGDEWFEIWRASGPSGWGDLLFVGTVTNWTVDEAQIILNGYDGKWTLKKSRESTVGLWVNSPRDVFLHYTKAVVAVAGDIFQDKPNRTLAANFPASPTVLATSTDGQWKYISAIPATQPGFLRLAPNAGFSGGLVRTVTAAVVGLNSTAFSDRTRFEATFITPPTLVSSSSLIGLYVRNGSTAIGSLTISGNTGPLGGPIIICAWGTAPALSLNANAPYVSGMRTFIIEVRGRWIWFFIDGKVVGVLPCDQGPWNLTAEVNFSANALDVNPSTYVDVQSVLVRQTAPYLARGLANTPATGGDVRLPGVPVPSGLQATYYSDTDLLSDVNMGLKQLNPAKTGTAGTGFAVRRVDPSIAFVAGIGGWPPAIPNAQAMSARWTGSVYLDLAHYDYKFLVQSSAGGMRLWLGYTRFGSATSGDQMADYWLNGNSAIAQTVFGQYTVSARTWIGDTNNTSGWYPFILEGQGLGITTQQVTAMLAGYIRSDQPNYTNFGLAGTGGVTALNVGGYTHLVLRGSYSFATPRWDWPLNDPPGLTQIFPNTGAATSGGTATEYLQLYAGVAGTFMRYQRGPIPNENAIAFVTATGTSAQWYRSVTAGPFNTTAYAAGYTVEVWVNPADSTTAGTILFRNNVFTLSVNVAGAGLLRVQVGNGTTFSAALNSTTAVPAATWSLVHVVYNAVSGACTIYINGVASGTATLTASMLGTNADQFALGAQFIGGSAVAGTFYLGGVSHLVLYQGLLPQGASTDTPGAESIYGHLNAAAAASAVPCSPQGVYEQQVRIDSHYEQLRQFAENFGYQYTTQPQSLESGHFPGILVPRVQEGRTTDFVLDHENTVQPRVTGNVDDAADALSLDAQGLADPTGSGQLFVEALNFPELAGNTHLFVNSDYDSPGDIQNVQQMVQRAGSLLTLRSSAWEQIDGNTDGRRELVDTFPLTGALAEFAWRPGDSIRFELPSLGIEDRRPRQILGAKWPFFPGGLGAPTVMFRARPRSFKEMLRKLHRESIDESRNYQGQFVVLNGNAAAPGGIAPAYSIVTLPNDLSTVARATFVVMSKNDTTNWNIEVNDVVLGVTFNFTNPGRIDISGYIARSGGGGDPHMYARATGNGGTSTVTFMLELLVRV